MICSQIVADRTGNSSLQFQTESSAPFHYLLAGFLRDEPISPLKPRAKVAARARVQFLSVSISHQSQSQSRS